ncbi:Beta-monoglucosyldiacylglycerol synthase [Rhodoplanes serenus]|uniref:Beta-monoglucosyldiacylglycerol synthase n=1 Tax=Rhodoplanes serenus TaxID=200615 RepID=A0A3S4B4E4_9BRAD|nr:Beta-monoglucosyldiacylglycerol synthase [Rhodoplanes serenus]
MSSSIALGGGTDLADRSDSPRPRERSFSTAWLGGGGGPADRRPTGPSRRDARRALDSCPEIDCVRHVLPPAVVAVAERRARRIGVTADRVLVAAGLLDEDTYARALARRLGVPFEPLDGRARAACPLPDDRLIEAAAAGLLPLADRDGHSLVVAPRGAAARRLAELAGSPVLPPGLRITTGARLGRFVRRTAATALGHRAAFDLATTRPHLSAAPRPLRLARLGLALTAVIPPVIAWPDAAVTALGVVLAVLFLTWTGLRLIALARPALAAPPLDRVADDALPLYTVMVALYREAASVRRLVAGLDALDYPPEKLQIILILEADDLATRAALEAERLGPPYEILVAPDIGPRTKPKALDAGLPFARGSLLAVFDAEDRPEPDQLRRAVAAFSAGGERLACVQARLTIDNTRDGWLTALFTAEYAGLFDVFLPTLAWLRLPLPLGGSSNHFRTAALRTVGGWDPFNLTEDADLGIRLARHGLRSDVIASTTHEEAPARLGPWLRQRTRWFQGWMQTWLVHMRQPRRTLRDLGPAGFVTLHLVVGGTVLAALVHPLAGLAVLVSLLGAASPPGDGVHGVVLTTLFAVTFVSGWAASVLLGLAGLARRRLLATAWVLLLVPVHWLLLATAAWRALIKLVRDPYRWDKTEHGLAKTSRSGAAQGGGGRSTPAISPDGGRAGRSRQGRKKPEVEPATSQ